MNNYQRSFDKVLTYIDNKLDEKQDLDTLAAIANLSKFHFHKIMKAYLNETLGNYINRLRLESAIKLLRYSNQPIYQIAYQVGFETVSAFNKSFKKRFGVSPTSIRKQKIQASPEVKKIKMSEFQLVKTIKNINDIEVVFQQSRGTIGDEETKRNWETLFSNAQAQQILSPESKFYGISWDDPEITPFEKIRYDACISIKDSQALNDKFSKKKIVGGKYLCFLYKGEYQNLGFVYNQIFREWVIKEDYNLRDVPIFEQYINNKEVTPAEDLLTEIFIPIK